MFPDRVSFEEEILPTPSELRIDDKTIRSDVKTDLDLMMPPKGDIEVGKLETMMIDTIRDEEKLSKISRDSGLKPETPVTDFTITSRLTKLTPLMVAAMNK